MSRKIIGNRFKNLIAIAISLIAALFNWRISLGFLLGIAFSRIHMILLSARLNAILDSSLKDKEPNAFLVFFGGIIDLLVLAIPLAISYFLGGYFHWLGVGIGLLFEKLLMYISALLKKDV